MMSAHQGEDGAAGFFERPRPGQEAIVLGALALSALVALLLLLANAFVR